MVELVFPVVATLALVLVAIPTATIICKWILMLWRWATFRLQQETGDFMLIGVREAGSNGRYFLLLAPVVIPALWLVSAALHHAEAKEAVFACLFEHVTEGACSEPLMIAITVTVALCLTFLWRRHAATRFLVHRRLAHDPGAENRIDRACAGYAHLQAIRNRIWLVDSDDIRTVGLWRPSIEVGVALTHALGEQALTGALLHECEHLRGLDPLRFLALSVCWSLNPSRSLLDNEVARWRVGREAICDEAAVHYGADPCGLAEALLVVARPRSTFEPQVAHLGQGGGMRVLRVRVALLMQFVTSMPRCRCARWASKLAALAVVVVATLPHFWGDRAIVELHRGAERIATDALIGR